MRDFLVKSQNFLLKIERNKHIIAPVLLMIFCVFIQTDIVFGADGATFGKDILTKILNSLINVIFIGIGALILVFGVVEAILAITGQNPDAKNKAILGLGAGIVMIVLGIVFLGMVDQIVSFFIS